MLTCLIPSTPWGPQALPQMATEHRARPAEYRWVWPPPRGEVKSLNELVLYRPGTRNSSGTSCTVLGPERNLDFFIFLYLQDQPWACQRHHHSGPIDKKSQCINSVRLCVNQKYKHQRWYRRHLTPGRASGSWSTIMGHSWVTPEHRARNVPMAQTSILPNEKNRELCTQMV